jgi:hypothetical protein
MKKLLLSSIVLTLSFFGAKAQMAQGDFHFGVGLNLGLPLGDFKTTNSFGIGAHIQGEYNFTENVTGVATTGYTSYFGKTYTFDEGGGNTVSIKASTVGLIPVLVGVRFYPVEQFFVGAQAGLGIVTGGSSSTSAFDYYPQIGYNADNFQVIFGYNGLSKDGSTLSNLSLTGIFKFGGGK